ncbi:hypothetical protein [Actinokineospora enzanensis]|uniref:hypothetical protein n=1 Tax=Actinokineospora enzanensis TaxID=155975 RepID=UPI0012EB4D14|nr:hypothetical protein [Actinokineospora enzanensis]
MSARRPAVVLGHLVFGIAAGFVALASGILTADAVAGTPVSSFLPFVVAVAVAIGAGWFAGTLRQRSRLLLAWAANRALLAPSTPVQLRGGGHTTEPSHACERPRLAGELVRDLERHDDDERRHGEG